MPTLIVDAGTASPISLTVQTAGENAPIEVGSVTPSFNMTDRSSVRGTKMTFGALTTYLAGTAKDALINKLKNGRQIACSGDLLGNIQKQCTLRYTGARMLPQFADLWEVGLTGNEVNPNVVLLKYAPGDVVTGEVFTRSTVGYYRNGNISNPLSQAAINAKRDSHFINSVRSILLEAGSTDNFLQANDFSNAAWTKGSCTVTTGIADPLGGTSACTLTATGVNGFVSQILAVGPSIVRTNPLWIRRRTGSGVVNLTDQAGLNSLALPLTANWQPFAKISSSAGVTRRLDLIITTSGDAIDVWDGRQDDNAFPTSEILTTTVPVSRGADNYSMPFTAPPGEMTLYMKFVEKGTSLLTGHLFSITSAGGGSPFFRGLTSAGVYLDQHQNTAGVTSTVPVAALDDVVELVFRLFGDGSVDITKSVNGGAAVAGTQSAANPLAAAWAGQTLWLNAFGSTTDGFIALQSLKAIAGARSLDEMRSL